MEPFIEYHGLLHEVLEVCIRKKESVMHLQCWYTDAKCTKEYKANMPDQDPNAKTQTADDTGEKPTGIRIPGYPTITIEADKKDVQMNLMNPEGNPCYFTFEIVLNDTDETIYTSKMVEP